MVKLGVFVELVKNLLRIVSLQESLEIRNPVSVASLLKSLLSSVIEQDPLL